ncbi:MAG: iron-containing alcohol dehydrogenase [Planctomycetota bacterium]
MPNVFSIPSRVLTGAGSFASLADEVARLGAQKPLIVSDPGMEKAGLVEKARANLSAARLRASAFTGVQPDPTMDNVVAGLAALRENACDSVLALGGGSSIDCAKAVAVLATNPGSIRDYQGANKIPNAGLPLLAIPTTAGTGSEVTRVCIITDTERNVKMLLIDPHLMPTVAIVDPELTYSMPPALTAGTGVDALTHAIEAYVSVKHQPITDALALSAVRRLSANLLRAFRNPADKEARSEALQGSLEAGMAFSNSSVCLVHGMSRPIGACFHLPHGLSNAILLPTVVEYSLPGAPERYRDLALAMGLAVDPADLDAAGRALVAALRKLNRDVKIPGPRELGIDRAQWEKLAPKMAGDALASGSPNNNPRVPAADEIVALYMKLWDL